MTSGNRGNEPIIAETEEARETLRDIAELFLVHDRRIIFPNDDSIVRLSQTGPVILRRSRGYVPGTLHLGKAVAQPTLAAGSDLKSAPAVAVDAEIIIAPHVGDLSEPSGRTAYERAVGRMLSLYSLAPKRIVYDLHPSYFSSGWAKRSGIPLAVPVQHHYAHVLSVMAEHGLEESLGVAFDGTGYGSDGTVWGGEFLHATRRGFRRLGSFRPFALPGGDAAIRHPLRILFSLLHRYPVGSLPESLSAMSQTEINLLAQMIDAGVNSPLTSSVGRLFDAAAALLGLVREVSYEGEGPMKLETLAATALNAGRNPDEGALDAAAPLLPIESRDNPMDPFRIDARPLLAHLAGAAGSLGNPARALLFHQAIAASVVKGALEMRDRTGVNILALSGGVFQNVLIRNLLLAPLTRAAFTVYWNQSVPPGDGGIAVGQAWYTGGEPSGGLHG
jgi:hydrogenase maturation protein HypF